jgi:hypothetical protein
VFLIPNPLLNVSYAEVSLLEMPLHTKQRIAGQWQPEIEPALPTFPGKKGANSAKSAARPLRPKGRSGLNGIGASGHCFGRYPS